MKTQRNALLPLLLLLAVVSTGTAQSRFRKPLKEASHIPIRFADYHLGLKVGCPWNLLTKSDLAPVYLGHFGYEFGLSAERHFKQLSVGMEVLWASRGTRMMGQSTYQPSLHTIDVMRYETDIAYEVLTARTPLTWYVMSPFTQRITPYLFVAPGIEYAFDLDGNNRLNFQADSLQEFLENPLVPATATYTQYIGPDTTIRTEPWAPPGLDLTVTAGTGVMATLPTRLQMAVKFDVGVRLGLRNLASEALKNQSVRIRNCGVEASLTFFFGIQPPLHDACHYFQKRSRSNKLPWSK